MTEWKYTKQQDFYTKEWTVWCEQYEGDKLVYEDEFSFSSGVFVNGRYISYNNDYYTSIDGKHKSGETFYICWEYADHIKNDQEKLFAALEATPKTIKDDTIFFEKIGYYSITDYKIGGKLEPLNSDIEMKEEIKSISEKYKLELADKEKQKEINTKRQHVKSILRFLNID